MIFAVGTYTFERDLFRFVTRIETAQLQTFASEIEYYYAEVQTWDFQKNLSAKNTKTSLKNLRYLENLLNQVR